MSGTRQRGSAATTKGGQLVGGDGEGLFGWLPDLPLVVLALPLCVCCLCWCVPPLVLLCGQCLLRVD